MTLSITNITSSGANYQITGLDKTWSTANYSQCCLTLISPPSGGGSSIADYNYIPNSFMYTTAFGLSNQTEVGSVTLTPATNYTLYAAVQKTDGKWYPYGFKQFSTPSGSSGTPTGALNLSISEGAFVNTFSISWDAVSGSQGSTTYELWMKNSSDFNDSYFVLNTTTTSTSIFSLSVSEYRLYDFWLRSKNNAGYGVDQKIYGKYPRQTSGGGGTPQGRPYWEAGDTSLFIYTNAWVSYSSETVTADGSAVCNVGFNGALEYPTQYQISVNDNVGSGWVIKSTPALSFGNKITLDRTNHTYTIRVTASNSYGDSLNYLEKDFTTPNWVKLWDWASPKVAGEPFYVTAAEWNDFTGRINAYRQFHDFYVPQAEQIGQYGFTTAPYGDGSFFAFMYNQVVASFTQLNPPTPLPSTTASTKVAGDTIYAKYFADLKTTINSLHP